MHIERLKEAIKDTNFSIMSGEYAGVRSKFKFVCNDGHEFIRSYDSVVNLGRKKCPQCDGRYFDSKYIKQVMNNEGYELLSEYKNANSKMTVRCPNGHTSEIFYSNFSRGHRCLLCSDNKWTHEEIDSKLSEIQYKRTGEYRGVFDKFSAICSEGHEINLVLNDFNKGSRCSICYSSNLEIDFESEFRDSGIKYYIRDRKTVAGIELDFFFPDFQLAVELHGCHWHSDQFKDKYYHRDKYRKCKEQNINLIQVYDFEWYKRRKQIVGYIKSKLNIYDCIIYARECDLVLPNDELTKRFIEDNHIQGYRGHIEAYGLNHKNELVGVITINRHHRNSNQLILNRLCMKNGVKVIGGVKRIFESIPNKRGLITHADLRFTSGEIYTDLGFVILNKLKPDYLYVKNGKTKSKQSMKKTKEEITSGKTESELRREQGYKRVWDAGKVCFIYN